MSDKIYNKYYLKNRRVVSYPPEPIRNKLRAYSELTEDSESEFVSDAIKEKLARQPEQLQELINKKLREGH